MTIFNAAAVVANSGGAIPRLVNAYKIQADSSVTASPKSINISSYPKRFGIVELYGVGNAYWTGTVTVDGVTLSGSNTQNYSASSVPYTTVLFRDTFVITAPESGTHYFNGYVKIYALD